MTQDNTSVEELEVTETSQTQANARTYSQKEFDDAMAKAKSAIARKVEKKFEDLGDVEELRKLKSEFEERQRELELKKGNFDKVLQEIASKKDAEIAKRDNIIREYKIRTPLVSAAAKYKAINADQVNELLGRNLRLDDDGEVEVVDSKGEVRYNDNGHKLNVDDLVKEFLKTNPHFVSPTPATTHSKSNLGQTQTHDLDITKLNMNDPKDREVYKKYRQQTGIR